MRIRLIAAALCLAAVTAFAAPPAAEPALVRYVTKSVLLCPGAVVRLEPIDRQGPKNFQVFGVTHTSSNSQCGRNTYTLYSPATKQVIVGDVWALPPDLRTSELRVAEFAGKLLGKPVRVAVDRQARPDGIRRVSMTTDGKEGPLTLTGWLDESESFFFVGRPGTLGNDPGKGLLSAIGAEKAATRGAKNAKVSVVELSDFQCPACAGAHAKLEPLIVKNLDKIEYRRVDLPLVEHHEWSMRAALAARAINKLAPASYWKYIDTIFRNQPNISGANIEQTIQDFAESEGIDWAKMQSAMRSESERKDLLRQVGSIYDQGVFGTPTFIVNGQMVFHGKDADNVEAVIRSLLN